MINWQMGMRSGWDLDRDKAKKVVMNIIGIKNNIGTTIAGTSIAMAGEQAFYLSQDNGGSRHDIHMMYFYTAVDTKKAHNVKETAKWGVKLAQAFGGASGLQEVSGLGELGGGLADASGFEGPNQSAHNKNISDRAYRHFKKTDKRKAAATQKIHAVAVSHFVTKEPTVNNQGGIDRDTNPYLYLWHAKGGAYMDMANRMFDSAVNNSFHNIRGFEVFRVNRLNLTSNRLGPASILFDNNNNNNQVINNNNQIPLWAELY